MFDADRSDPRLWMLMDSPAHGSILRLISANGKEEPVAEYVHGVKLITLDVDISGLGHLDAGKRDSLARWFGHAEMEADVLLISICPPFPRPMMAILQASSDVVVMAAQPTNEMVVAYGVIKAVVHANRGARVGIVSSGIGIPDQSDRAFGKLQSIAGRFLGKSLHDFGYIPEDTEIPLSMTRRRPLSLSSPWSETVRSITEISRSVLGMRERVVDERSAQRIRGTCAEKLFSKAS